MFWRRKQKRKNLPHLKMVNGRWVVIGGKPMSRNERMAYFWASNRNDEILSAEIWEQQVRIARLTCKDWGSLLLMA